jgi:hypothetical protein
MQELGHGRRARGAHWVTEGSLPGVSWGTEDSCPNLFWGTEDSSDPDIPGARKTAATRKSPGHGKPPRPGYPWGMEDGDPDIPGARTTATRVSLGHGRRQPGYPWVTENEHEVGWGDGRRAKLLYDRARCIRC